MTMKRILDKLERIGETVNDTRVSIGKIEKHLEILNGTVQTNTKDIKLIFKNNYKLVGALGIVVTVLTVVLSMIF